MAVLSLLVVMVTQTVNSSLRVITSSHKQLDVDGQVRLIFDRMASDFAAIPKRKDLDAIFEKIPASGTAPTLVNDDFFFYSEAPAYFGGTDITTKSPVALVGYRINASNSLYPGKPVLERLGKALSWDGKPESIAKPGSVMFLTYPPPSSPAPSAAATPLPDSLMRGNWPTIVTGDSTDPDFYVIGDAVFRLEICFLLTDGTISNQPYLGTSGSLNGFQDVAGIIVAVAALDADSRKLVPDMGKLASAFPDSADSDLQSSSPPVLMSTRWLQLLNKGAAFSQSVGIPPVAASQIRVYQRCFYLGK